LSINLGAGVHEAVADLRKHEQWKPFLEAFEQQVTTKIQDSLNSPLDTVVAANFYARALNDVYIALVAATYDVNPRQVGTPGSPSKVMASV
jgi:hypothetical protein